MQATTGCRGLAAITTNAPAVLPVPPSTLSVKAAREGTECVCEDYKRESCLPLPRFGRGAGVMGSLT